MKEILIVGAGYVGAHLARHLMRRPSEERGAIRVTLRDEQRARALENEGVEVIRFDVLEDDAEMLASSIGPDTFVIYSIPTLFKTRERGA